MALHRNIGALHRNIGYISPYDQPTAIDEQFMPTNGGGGGGSYPVDESIVIEEYYPKDPVLYPIDPLDLGSGGQVIEEDQATESQPVQELPVQIVQMANSQLYVEGYIYDKKTNQLLPGVTIQIFDSISGSAITQPFILPDGSYSAWIDTDPAKALIRFSRKDYNNKNVLFSELLKSPDVYMSAEGNNAMLWMAAGAGMIFIASRKRKKKVGRAVDDVYKFYEGLPPVAKGILTVGGAYIIYKTLDKLLAKKPDDTKEPQEASDQVNNLASQGIYPTHSDADFESYSNSIVQAIWDCGTDEDAIYNVMQQMNNEADIYRLIAVYGVREYKGCFEGWFTLVARSLSGALSSELDADEKNHVNTILASKGISFRFT